MERRQQLVVDEGEEAIVRMTAPPAEAKPF
jgi:hypothetical protein